MTKKYVYVVQHDEDICRFRVFDDKESAIDYAYFIIEEDYDIGEWSESKEIAGEEYAEQDVLTCWFDDRDGYGHWVSVTSCEVNEGY